MDNPLIAPHLHTLAQDFIWNADNALKDASPFYEKLARGIATDPELLALAAHCQPHQPVMNLFLSSVHYLLMRGLDDPLALFYADLTRKPNVTDDPYPIFRAFCLEHAPEIIALVRTRRVQTNEVARCALLLPAFTLISQRLGGQALSLIEVGASAGLNLNWDHYSYTYGDGKRYGDPASPVLLECELRGHLQPPLPQALPPVADRLGIDLNPNDVFDDDAMAWLRALIWPEQKHRAERLARAIALAREFPPRILQGDALALVPQLLASAPPDVPVVLFHSFVLNQVPAEMRARYYDLVAAHSAGRIVMDLAIEPSLWPAQMVLTHLQNGAPVHEALANCDHHGRWLEWTL